MSDENREREALRKIIYESVRFANWAAGEGIVPANEDDAMDPADFLFEYSEFIGEIDWENLPQIARDAVIEGNQPK